MRRSIAFASCAIFFLFGAHCAAQTTPGGGGAGTGAGGGGFGGGGVGGILIDPDGLLKAMQLQPVAPAKRKNGKPEVPPGNVCVSLRRLADRLATADPNNLPPDLHVLGGLTRIDQIVLDSESKDAFLIGPAETQATGSSPTFVGSTTGRPLMRTGDFLILLASARNGRLNVRCSIDPDQDRLRQYNERIRATVGSVTLGAAAAWYADLARILGRQDITLNGIPDDSRVGAVLAAADYSMKRIALGLEASGVNTIRGQLFFATNDKGATMMRWWFAPYYDDIKVSADRSTFLISGPRIKLVAQQELIGADGQRSDADRNRPSSEAFARAFTEHFEELTKVRPIFADLKNQFDLTLAAALLLRERALDRFDINLQPSEALMKQLSPRGTPPKFVESGANVRHVNRTTVVGVVGGVEITPGSVLSHESPLAAGSIRSTKPPGGNGFAWPISDGQ